MKFIKPTTDFGHDGEQYYFGERRKVDDDLAGYFRGVGWAIYDDEVTATQNLNDKTLVVHNISHKSSAPSIGVK